MNQPEITTHVFEPRCLATTIGSLPHTDVAYGTRIMLDYTPDIPGWAQFPKISYRENMMLQFTDGMPGLVKKVWNNWSIKDLKKNYYCKRLSLRPAVEQAESLMRHWLKEFLAYWPNYLNPCAWIIHSNNGHVVIKTNCRILETISKIKFLI